MGVELEKDLRSRLVIYLAHGEGDTGMGVELDKDLIQVSNLSKVLMVRERKRWGLEIDKALIQVGNLSGSW